MGLKLNPLRIYTAASHLTAFTSLPYFSQVVEVEEEEEERKNKNKNKEEEQELEQEENNMFESLLITSITVYFYALHVHTPRLSLSLWVLEQREMMKT